jgi:hypothetical protein
MNNEKKYIKNKNKIKYNKESSEQMDKGETTHIYFCPH